MLVSLLCPVGTCWHKHKRQRLQPISKHFTNHVLTKHNTEVSIRGMLMLVLQLSPLAYKLLVLVLILLLGS